METGLSWGLPDLIKADNQLFHGYAKVVVSIFPLKAGCQKEDGGIFWTIEVVREKFRKYEYNEQKYYTYCLESGLLCLFPRTYSQP